MNREFHYWLAATAEIPEQSCQMPFTFQVYGCSMYPLIRSGEDEVTMVRWSGDKQELKPGDIVFFACPQVALGYVVHRIIKKDGERILTMGDGNLNDDGWTDMNQVIGKIVKIQRGRFSFDPNGLTGRGWFYLWRLLFPVRRQMLSLIHLCGRGKHWIKGQ